MKKLLSLLLAIVIVGIVYFVLLPLYNNYRLNKDLDNVNNILAFTKNYYGYNTPNEELLSNDEVFEKIGFKGKKPSFIELHISNKEVAAAIIYNNTCYYKNYNENVKSKTITNDSKCSIYGIVSNDNCFTIENNTITDYNKTCGSIVNIPDKINNSIITEIGENAFENKDITQVVIPSSIKKINSYAFSNNSINYLIIQGSEILDYAFSNNDIQTLTLNSKYIGKNAFENNSIKELNISNSVNIIDDNAFTNNNLKHVYIVGSVTKIGTSAFSDNELESIILSNGLKEIGDSCFINNKLTNVVIPSSVTTIGSNAFYKDAISNSDLSLLYNATKNEFDFEKIIGSNYKTVDISKL